MENFQSQTERLVEYCFSGNAATDAATNAATAATESAKAVTDGIKSVLSIILPLFEDEEDEEDISEYNFTCTHNPLLIDLIVKNVMKYLPVSDLCSCRQVCKLWNAEAGAYFRKQQRIIFYPESVLKMREFTLFMAAKGKVSENNLPPFTSFCFTAQFPGTQFSNRMMKNFVSVYGHNVKTLQVFYPDDGILSGSDFKTFFIQGMPNLETIHFVNLPLSLTQKSFLGSKEAERRDFQLRSVVRLKIDRTWQMETCWKEEFLRDLLSLMPKLEEYEIWTWNSTQDAHSKPYLVSLSQQQNKSLKVLRPGSIGEDLGHCLTDLGIRLTKLFLPVLNKDISSKTLEALLLSQENTLEEFQLNCSSVQDSRFIQFPYLPRLKNLHLIITFPWNNELTEFSPAIDYKNQLPSLQTLKLELAVFIDLGFSNYFFPPNSSTVSNTLQELDLSFNGFRDETFIGSLAVLFPNLLRFRLNGYGNRIFSSICFHLQNLEELELYLIYGFNIDDQLTGIPKDTCADLRRQFNCTDKNNTSLSHNIEEGEQLQIFPSLRSLTKLHTLSIRQKDNFQGKFLRDSQCLTEVTVYLALANMKQLKRLQIKSIQFSDQCRKLLCESLEDCWLDFL